MGKLLWRMRKLETDKPPVSDPGQVDNVQAWVKPEIVVEVKYYEKSKNGLFRFPDFIRVRHDKEPEECKV